MARRSFSLATTVLASVLASLFLERSYAVVPIPLVQITIFDNETLENETLGNVTIGEPLTLDCTVTAVRGISSSVDIIWTTGGRVVRRVDNITADIENDSAIYTDSFEISSLSAIDNGREYQCTVVINASPPVNNSDQITLNFSAPVCFNTTYCGGESARMNDNSVSFHQCCFELHGVSFVTSGQCLQCPKGCSKHVVRDVVFVVDTGSSRDIQPAREVVENVTINLKVNSPGTLFSLITFDRKAQLVFNITNHTDLSTLLPAINSGLSYRTSSGINMANALSLLLSESLPGGLLKLRNETSNVAIVIASSFSYSDEFSLFQSTVNSLHAANAFDVYAVGIGNNVYSNNNRLRLTASNPSLVFSTISRTSQPLVDDLTEQLCSTPTPRIFLKPSYLPQGAFGEPYDLVCLIALSSLSQVDSVNLTWNFTSNDDRVTVIPTTNTTDDSIGIIYTTVIQFNYLMEGDEESYTCNSTIEGVSTFNLKVIDPIVTVTVEVIAAERLEIFQPLVLQCTAAIVRAITSTVDIIWTTGNTQVRRVNNVTASSNTYSQSIYNDSFIIPSLNVSDIGNVYQCEASINSVLPSAVKTGVVIPIPGSRCSGNSVQDIVFVIDASSRSSLFQLIREFTANITADLIRSSPRNAVGVIVFTRSVFLRFNLQTYTNLSALLSAINEIPLDLSPKGTDTVRALRFLLSSAQNGALGLRNDSSKVAIVITDGEPGRAPSAIVSAAAALHASNIFDVYAVGIGGRVDLSTLKGIASNPDFVFTDSFSRNGLYQLHHRIVPELCYDTLKTFLQPSGFDQNTVGQRQDVICSISVPPDVDPDTIELGWLNEDDIITNDSRVTIDTSSYYFNDSTLVKAIHFNRLIENDQGEYTCYAIVNGSFKFEFMNLENFIIPVPHVLITIYGNETIGNETLGNVTIGDPLTLDCTVTAIKGISSSVDIIWTTGGRVVRRVDNITADIENDSAIYTDSFKVTLSATDNGREYQCTVVINRTQPVNNSDEITVIFPGPVCFNTTYCGNTSLVNYSVSFQQCCFELSGVSFTSFGRCFLCPKECSVHVVRDVVFVVDTSNDIDSSTFQQVREFTENITINLKVNAPETSFALVTFNQDARLEFSISNHTDLSTLLPAINPGLPYYYDRYGTNTASALSLLLAGGVPGGFLHLRNDISKLAIVITGGRSSSDSSLYSAANSLHAANIFDVYAVGIGSNDFRELQTIASDPSFVTRRWSPLLPLYNFQFFTEDVIEQLCSNFAPRTFLRPNYLQQGTIGEPHDLVCLIALSSTAQPSSVNLTWNFTSNDDRVTVIPTTITTNDSIGIIYTTVIQFDYLMEGDEGNYTCTLTIDENTTNSTFHLEIINPVTAINVIAANVPTIYQPLILQCNATVVRGNTNVVDIIWTTGNTQVRRVNNVTASSNIDLLSSYSDSFIIPSMNVSDIGSVYECEVLINSASPTTRKTDFIIPIPGDRCSLTDNSIQDLVFVIDGCSSSSFILELIREFTANITTEIIHNFPSTAVGLISRAEIQFNLQTYTTLSELVSAINELPLNVLGGIRHIGEAVNLLLSTAQNETLGLRSNSSKVAIFLTTSHFSSRCSLGSSALASLHASNIFDEVYAVGFSFVNLNNLEAIASSPELIFTTTEFDGRGIITIAAIQQVLDRVLQQMCHDSIVNITLQPSGFNRNTVGQGQDVICSISVLSDVDPDTIEFGWLNEDDIIADDSRVTIVRSSNDSFNGSTLVTTIHFDPLFEEDEDEYICYAILNESLKFDSIVMQNFTIPIPVVQITIYGKRFENETLGNVTIGDPLMLDCTVTAVRGISSSVDIIWTTGGRVVRRVDNITADIENDSAIYTDSFKIPSTSATDNGREYQCTVVINASQPVYNSDEVILIFPGPVCFNTTYCGGESFNDTSLSFAQCCFILSGKSFVASTQCLQCPLDCSVRVVRDVVFVVDTSNSIGLSKFQLVRELIGNITVNLKRNSPETLFDLITFDDVARYEFNISNHTDLNTLLPAINPGLPYYGGSTNTGSALRLLLSGSTEGGFLQLRNKASNVAIVITDGYSSSYRSLQSAASSLHVANIFDVYAVGISNDALGGLQVIASDPSFVFFTNFLTNFTAQQLVEDVIEKLCSTPTTVITLRPSYLQLGTIGEPHDLVCLIALSSILQPSSVNLTWNFTSNDDRVTVIPTTITTDDSIGIIYTTVIQFDYLMEGDEGNYKCTSTIDGNSTYSTFNLNIVYPSVIAEVTAITNVTIYQPLILQCTATTVRGITSTVDIIWTTGNTQVRRVYNVTASSNINSSSIYNDSFIIPSLNVSHIESVYECEILINSIVSTRPKADFTIPIPGNSCSAESLYDIVFMIDTSGSIGISLYRHIREFTANITAELIHSYPRSAFGVILFSNSAYIEFNLQAHSDLSELLSAINQLPYNAGGTNTSGALQYLLTTAQNGSLGLRRYSFKIAIVITDGESIDRSATFSSAAALHASNVFDVFSVGVDETVTGNDLTELRAIASSPEFVFFTSSFYSTGLRLLQNRMLCKDPILSISLQPSGFGPIVGERQDVICSISVPPDVDPDTIEFGWLNEDNIITNDSRVTIDTSSDYINDNTLVTTIHFDPLFEEDDAQYVCYAIINGSFIYEFTDLLRVEIPIPLVQITVFHNETFENETLRNVTISDPLTLDCTVTAVRGISSSVDIIWTTGGRVVRRVDNITADIENDSAIYTDSFEISSISAIDNGREYQCTVVINAIRPVYNSDQFTLIFPVPVCYSTPYCGGESYGDYLVSFHQCCIRLSGMSFVSFGTCLSCPKDCSRRVVRDVVFMIDTSTKIGVSEFQLVREVVENITISIKVNSPESLFGLITFDHEARLEFNISNHTALRTLLPAINPGLTYYHTTSSTDTANALSFLLSGGGEGGFLQLRNETSNLAIVIADRHSFRLSSLRSVTDSLHAANIFDVYAVGIGGNSYDELELIASDPSFIFSARSLTNFTAQRLEEEVIEQLCSTFPPTIVLKPSDFRVGRIGYPYELVCLIALSSKMRLRSVSLTWNFTSNDDRVTVIPTTITTDYSIGIIYTTVIQFDYLMEGDEGNYICTLTIDNDSAESNFTLQIINPIITVEVTNTNYPTIYQPLILQCTATTVGNITSTVDIIWTTGTTQVRRVNNVTASSNINSSSIYNDSFIIPSLNVSDIGSVYECEVLINSVVPTTAKTNFMIPIPATGSRCSSTFMQDVVFVIDISGTIGSQLIREFVTNITAELVRNSPTSLVGMIAYSSFSYIEFDLQTYTDLDSLLSAIDQISYFNALDSNRRGSDTAEALTLLLSTAQNGLLGLRNDSAKVAIVIANGRSDSGSSTLLAASALHATNIFDVYAVGVGGSFPAEVETIASSPEFVFSTRSIDNVSLQQLYEEIIQQLCNDSVLNITLQPSGFNRNTVGQRQDVICSISVPPDVDPNTVEFGWLNEDDIITNDSRVTIDTSVTYLNGSTLITTIQFNPLAEEDEDDYLCYAIIKRSFINESIYLQNFIIPIPFVQITVFDNETLENETLRNVTIGDPLTLYCTVTAARGISSSVDIIWTTGGRVVRRVDNITADIEYDSAIYTDSFEISSLSAIDNRREYQCTVVINASQPVYSSDQITLIFPGPICFNTTYCGGESFGDNSLTFYQCCFELNGVSFVSSGQCLLCPEGCSKRVVRDVVFVVDTSSSIGLSRFQLVREVAESVTISIKVNSPEALFGLITFDDFARFQFDIFNHTDVSTLLPAINPGLPYYGGLITNTSSALRSLLSGSVPGGFLRLRDKASKVAIVITDGISSSYSSLQSAANSLHTANIFDVYAVGIGNNSLRELQAIASDPSYVFSTSFLTTLTAQQLEEDLIEQLCSTPKPMTVLQPNYLQQGIIGDAHALICLIALSSEVQLNLVNLIWNFTSNDDRVTVIPTTITTDDSIGIIYTTVIQFDYLMEGDKGNYTCTLTIDGDSAQSIFNLEIMNPVFSIEVTTVDYPTIYQPLMLQCTATTVGNITSTVDIIWTTGNTQVRRVNNVTASSNINSSSIYNDSFIIPSLNVSDIGSVYECEVVINSVLPTTAKTDFILPIPGSICSGSLFKEVVFVIDTSGSIGSSNFQRIREFIANITAELIRVYYRSAFGVILFDSDAHIEFNVQNYTSKSALLSAINNLPYSAGGTDKAEALTLLLSSAQNGSLGLRNDSSKIAIVVTDGQSSRQTATLSAAAALHASNIFDVYAVGIDLAVLTELQGIASSPEFVFFTSSFNNVGLQQLQQQIIPQLCNESLLNISLRFSEFGPNIIGERQDVICSISIPPDVDPDTIEFGWLNEDDIITDDSRVSIVRSSNDNFNDNTTVTVIQFDPLKEEDEDEYICFTIMNESFIFKSINLKNFTDIDECVEGLDGCDQICINTVGSYYCTCMDGYELESDNRTCIDIDECERGISGCQHICDNIDGSFYCSCNPGYTLNQDGRYCAAQPCPLLMTPQNGNILCDGEHVTDTTCTFQCDLGYRLVGSVNRTCLPNNTWSGETTNCNILLCEELQNPENGVIILPCSQEYGTICTIECLTGYFTIEEMPVQLCDVIEMGQVEWTPAPSCQENQLCTPNPCEHSGVCNITGPSSFSCDCNGTGYAGMKCEIGIITTPDYQPLTLSTRERFTFYANPDFDLVVELITGTVGLTFEPSAILTFSPTKTSADIFITGERVGIYTIDYEINGISSVQFQQPQPDNIIVQEDTPPIPEYFTSRGLEPGILEAGSCAFAAPLDYTCPNENDQISFSSTCRWYDNASPGIIFSEYNDLNLPVTIIGARISNVTSGDQSRITPLMGNDFLRQCNFDSPQISCNFRPSDLVQEIEDFLMTEALGYTFLNQVQQLIPGWLTFSVNTTTPRTHDSTSYMIDLVESDYLAETEECSNLFRVEDGMYSILKYSGSLNLNINSSLQTFISQELPVCFAINLCKGLNSPLLTAIPDEAQATINSLPFAQIIRNYGWDFNINSIAISDTPFSHDFSGSSSNYWFGNQEATYIYPNSTIIANGRFHRSFSLDTLQINYSLDGHAYMLYNDINMVFELGLTRRWDGFMLGLTEITVSVPVHNQMSSLLLTGDSTPVLLGVGGTRTSNKRCTDCNDQQGIAFKLDYDIREGSTGIWSQLVLVPPKLEFGLPTQFSCPINGFIYFDSSFGLQAISMMSTCIDIQLGRFPIMNLQNILYISNDCDLSGMCDVIDTSSINSNVNIYAWSVFPSSITELRLGYFMSLLPYGENRFGVASIISTNSILLVAKLFQLRIFVLGTSLTVEATIDQGRLYFNGTARIFGMYSALLFGSVEQTNEWNEAPLNIFGQMEDKFISTLQEDAKMYFNRSISNYQERISNVRLSLQTAQEQLNVIQNTNTDNNASFNAARIEYDNTLNAYSQANRTANEIQVMVDEAGQELNNLRMRLDALCTIVTCPEDCIPTIKCETCVTNVTIPIQGICNVTCTRFRQVKQVAKFVAVYRWGWFREEICIRRSVCSFWTCYTEEQCTIRSICRRYLAMEPVYAIVNETYQTTCEEPCQQGLATDTVEATCCASVGCDGSTDSDEGTRVPDPTCVNVNSVCEGSRQIIFYALEAAEDNSAILLRQIQEANRNVSIANLRVTRAMARLTTLETLLNQSSKALEEAQRIQQIAEFAYQRVLSDNDNIQSLIDLMIESNVTMLIEILNVTFDVTIITESPTSISLDVSYHVPLLNHTSTRRVVVDFQRIELSVRNAAMSIVEDIFLLNIRSKRSIKTARQATLETADSNELYFEEKCGEVSNLQEYIMVLNNSISSIAEMAISSMMSVTANTELIENLAETSMELFSQPQNINTSMLAMDFNVTFNSTTVELGVSETELELLGFLQNLGSLSGAVGEDVEEDSFRSWLLEMQDLHNRTATAAGFDCLSFSDCLNTVADVTDELLILAPSSIANTLLDAFPLARKALLDIVQSSNITITKAFQNLIKFYNIIGDVRLTSYYCAQPPVIIEQPPQRVNPSEGSTLQLTCNVSSDFSITYRWKRDGIELLNANLSIFTIQNIQLADSGNYTCEATNYIGTVITIEVSVEVQQPPAFFLEPNDIDVYYGDSNNATFQCNATGWPFPGFTWYFKPKNSVDDFMEIPGEVDNEYSVGYPKPENEGLYYCSASNEQDTIQSRIVELTVLEASVIQLSQNFMVRFTLNVDDNSLTDVSEESRNLSQAFFIGLIEDNIDLQSATIENITTTGFGSELIIIFSLISESIPYPQTSLDDISQLVPQAFNEWATVRRELENWITGDNLTINSSGLIYISDSSSVIIDAVQQSCPSGREISEFNNFLCSNCPPGTYQTIRVDTRLSAVDSQSRIVVPQCTECPVGYYQPDQGQITCDICPPGSTSITQGSRSCLLLCAQHYYSSSGFEPCTPCPEGSYALANGSTTCTNCNTSSTDVPTSICPIASTTSQQLTSVIMTSSISISVDQSSTIAQTKTVSPTESVSPTADGRPSSDSNNNLSNGAVAGIVVSVLIAGTILTIIFALIIVVSIKQYRNHNKSGINNITTVTSFMMTVGPSDEETNHEYVSLKSYHQLQDVDGKATEQTDVDGKATEQTDVDGKATEQIDVDGKATEQTDVDGKATEQTDVDGKATEQTDVDGKATEQTDVDKKTSDQTDN